MLQTRQVPGGLFSVTAGLVAWTAFGVGMALCLVGLRGALRPTDRPSAEAWTIPWSIGRLLLLSWATAVAALQADFSLLWKLISAGLAVLGVTAAASLWVTRENSSSLLLNRRERSRLATGIPWPKIIVLGVLLALWSYSWRALMSPEELPRDARPNQTILWAALGLVLALIPLLKAILSGKRRATLEAKCSVSLDRALEDLLQGVTGDFLVIELDHETSKSLQVQLVGRQTNSQRFQLDFPIGQLLGASDRVASFAEDRGLEVGTEAASTEDGVSFLEVSLPDLPTRAAKTLQELCVAALDSSVTEKPLLELNLTADEATLQRLSDSGWVFRGKEGNQVAKA